MIRMKAIIKKTKLFTPKFEKCAVSVKRPNIQPKKSALLLYLTRTNIKIKIKIIFKPKNEGFKKAICNAAKNIKAKTIIAIIRKFLELFFEEITLNFFY